MVAYADRTRVMTDAYRRRVITGSMVRATVLVDGFVRGTWTIKRERSTAALTVELFAPLSAHDQASVAQEGARLLAFTCPTPTTTRSGSLRPGSRARSAPRCADGPLSRRRTA
jgi:hypothetical protein